MSDAAAPSAEGTAGLRFDGASKWFRHSAQTVHALSQIMLEVPAGSFVSVIGPSGCGKSTMLRMAGGLIEPDRGSVTVGGAPSAEARDRKQFAFVPQTPALLPWQTVERNVSLLGEIHRGAGAGVDADEQRELLERMGLAAFRSSLPGELSGGLQQRVSLARAFALGAPVMLMDEPFSALDEITRADMRFLLLESWERVGSTVLFVTHSIPEAVILSDRVVVLSSRPGRVTAEIDVDLPRPRTRLLEDSAEFHRVVAQVRDALQAGWSS